LSYTHHRFGLKEHIERAVGTRGDTYCQ